MSEWSDAKGETRGIQRKPANTAQGHHSNRVVDLLGCILCFVTCCTTLIYNTPQKTKQKQKQKQKQREREREAEGEGEKRTEKRGINGNSPPTVIC